MSIMKYFLTGLIVIFVQALYPGMPPSYAPSMPPGAGAPGGEIQLSPEELEMLQAMERSVEQEKAKMSPEQLAQFNKTVEDLTKEFEKMKPEELDAFIGQVIFGQDQPPAQPSPTMPTFPPLTEPELPPSVPETVLPKKTSPADKIENALNLINEVISATNSFLNKIAIMPEFAGKLKKWSEQGKIKSWKQEFTWDIIKKNIEELVQKLYKMKQQDKANEYIHIHDFIANDALVNNLTTLNATLQNKEPKIEIEAFGLEPLSKDSRNAIRAILNNFIEALYTLEVPAALNIVIEKFDPEAKKLHDQEGAATKRAFEESKKLKYPTQTVTGGKTQEPFYGGKKAGYPDYPGGYGMPGGYYGGYDGRGGYGRPESPDKFDQKDAKKGGEAGGPGKDDKKDGKEKKEKAAKDTAAKRQADKFNANLDQALGAITGSKLVNIKNHLDKNEPADQETVAALRTAFRKLDDAARNIKALKIRFKDLKDDQKKMYRSDIKVVYDEHKPILDELLLQIRDVKLAQLKYSSEQKHLYLGEPAAKDKDGDKKAAAVSSGSSLSDLQNAIEKLNWAYKDL